MKLTKVFLGAIKAALGILTVVLVRDSYFANQHYWSSREKVFQSLKSTVNNPYPLQSSLEARQTGVRRTRGLRILVLDGGGSMGIVACTILVELEKELERQLRDKLQKAINEGQGYTVEERKNLQDQLQDLNQNGVFLADHFDMICGTSAGGMIAVAHGNERIRLGVLQTLFESGAAFASRFGMMSKLSGFIVSNALYDSEAFENLLRKVLPSNGRLDGGAAGRQLRMRERYGSEEAKRPRVFVVASPDGTNKPMLLSNYPVDEYCRLPLTRMTFNVGMEVRSDITAREASRATSAAPVFFSAALLEEVHNGNHIKREVMDGGLVQNSPVTYGVKQARMVFGDLPVDMIVSVACGIPKGSGKLSCMEQLMPNKTKLGRTLINAITNSEISFNEARQELATSDSDKSIHHDSVRINPTVIKTNLDESDPVKLKEIKEAVEELCQAPGNEGLKLHLQRVARNLLTFPTNSRLKPISQLHGAPLTELCNAAKVAMTRLPPPLVYWKSPEPLFSQFGYSHRLHESDQDDDRFVLDATLDDFHRRYEMLKPLIEFMEEARGRISAQKWGYARRNTPNEVFIAEIELARWYLARGFLYDLFDHARRLAFHTKTYTRQWRNEEGAVEHAKIVIGELNKFGLLDIQRLTRLVLEFDRANALYNMKLDKSDQACPHGFLWITHDQLETVVKTSPFLFGLDVSRFDFDDEWMKVPFGGYQQSPSVEQLFVFLRDCLDLAYKGDGMPEEVADFFHELNRALEARAPQWMKLQFSQQLSTIRAADSESGSE